MNITTPSTQEVADDLVAAVEVATDQEVPLAEKSYTRVLSKAIAGVDVLLFKYGAWALRQMFVRHASARPTVVNGQVITPLFEHGREVGVGDPRAATFAELVLTVTVELADGSQLDAGTQLLHRTSGVVFLATGPATLNASTVSLRVRAASSPNGGDGSGTIGNLEVGAELEFASKPPNVARVAIVASVAVLAADAEDVEDYRERVWRRKRARTQGGALADYEAWGEEPAGIARVFPYAGDPGEVDVYVKAVAPSDEPYADAVPTSGQLAAVEAAINFDADGRATRRPVTAAVNVLPITRVAFDVSVIGLVASDLQAAKDAIEAALMDHLYSREPYIEGLSVLPRIDSVRFTAVSGVVDEATAALGASFTGLTLTRESVPVVAYTLGPGELPKLGTLTFP